MGLASGSATRAGSATGGTSGGTSVASGSALVRPTGRALGSAMAAAAAVPSPAGSSGSRPRRQGKARDMGPSASGLSASAIPSLPVGGRGGRVRAVVQSSSSGTEEEEIGEKGETAMMESDADAKQQKNFF